MNHGRELDALVAEKVMGWKLLCYESGVYAGEPGQYDDAMNNDGWLWEGDETNREAYEFHPSTDIAAAWEVVEKIADPEKYDWGIETHRTLTRANIIKWNEDGSEETQWMAEADTAPHAICLAALKSLGISM